MAQQDINHIKKFNLFLNSNYPIKKYIHGKNCYKRGFESRLYICNKYFAKKLYDEYGLIPNRYCVQKLLEKIPECLYRDFIRGILDADGSIVSGLVNEKSRTRVDYKCRISFSTYETLIDFIQDYFLGIGLIEIKNKIRKRHEEEFRDGNCRILSYCGNKQIPRILNFLYKDTNVYLDRKYQKYLEILNYTTK